MLFACGRSLPHSGNLTLLPVDSFLHMRLRAHPAMLPALFQPNRPAPPPSLQDPLTRQLRHQLLPRLRKYLLHPQREPRIWALTSCGMLGCLGLPGALPGLLHIEPTSIQGRLLARLVDEEALFSMQLDSLAHILPGMPVDMRFPPMVGKGARGSGVGWSGVRWGRGEGACLIGRDANGCAVCLQMLPARNSRPLPAMGGGGRMRRILEGFVWVRSVF